MVKATTDSSERHPCASCDCMGFSGPASDPFCAECGHAAELHVASGVEQASEDASPCRHAGCSCAELAGQPGTRFCRACGHPSHEHGAPEAAPSATEPPPTSTMMLPGPGEGGCFSCDCEHFEGPDGVRACWSCGHARNEHRRPAQSEATTRLTASSATACTSCDCTAWDAPAGHAYCASCGHPARAHNLAEDPAPRDRSVLGLAATHAIDDRRAEYGVVPPSQSLRQWRSVIALLAALGMLAIVLALALHWRAQHRAAQVKHAKSVASTKHEQLESLQSDKRKLDDDIQASQEALEVALASAKSLKRARTYRETLENGQAELRAQMKDADSAQAKAESWFSDKQSDLSRMYGEGSY